MAEEKNIRKHSMNIICKLPGDIEYSNEITPPVDTCNVLLDSNMLNIMDSRTFYWRANSRMHKNRNKKISWTVLLMWNS